MSANYPRVGRVRISDEFLLESVAAVVVGDQHVGLLFAAGFIPVQVRDSWERLGYSEYVVLSPYFPTVPTGQEIPLYDVTIVTKNNPHTGKSSIDEIQIAGAQEPYQAICSIKIKALPDSEVSVWHNDSILSSGASVAKIADSLGIPVEAVASAVQYTDPDDPDPGSDSEEDTGAADGAS